MVTNFGTSESRTFSDNTHTQQFSQEIKYGGVGMLFLTVMTLRS